ncbi:predicted protein [Chaetoceros tenuissimus]|uniref:Uncharacterized protein n=1 Tax=Chaetoceros tenuissimus TaxID=426638 RepID=A0AAD3CX17_9STRA|nr:predicted protein [Chaetoceros tenuissimus]
MSIRSFSYRSVFLPEAYEQEAEVAWNQFACRRGMVSSKTTCSQEGVPSIIITDPAQSVERETSYHRCQSYNELLDRSNNIDDLFQDVICQFEHCLDLTYQGTDNISEITDPQHVKPYIKDRSLVKDSELFVSCSTISTAVDTILADVDNTMDLFSNAIESIQCCIEEVEQCNPLRNLTENV